MKRSLFLKLVVCYVFIALFMFVLLNTYGVERTKTNLLEEKKNILYKEAQLISSEFMDNYFSDIIDLSTLTSQLKTVDTLLDCRIWFVNKDGIVIADTRDTATGELNVLDYDNCYLDSYFHVGTTMNGYFSESVLSTIYPVTASFQFRGYIVLNTAMANIEQRSIYFTDIFNICILIILAALLFIFFYISYVTVRPLKKIITATNEYTSGHFDYPLDIRSHDEYRDLCNAITYMVGEMNNMDEYRRKFIANISHDFRSPLTSIKGYAEAMLDGTIPVDAQGKFLDIILFETERLTKLTSNLLELNNFDNNGTLLERASFDINRTIKKVAAAFEGICMDKKITLKLIFTDSETFVNADIGKIQQVLYNLLDNAIKFSHTNAEIRISAEEKNDKIFISVKDYGIGIPRDSLKKIWERFYKTDTSRGKDKKGTGLGLSITKEIIAAHGENIDVISTEGVGTEFIFTLSKAEDE